MTFTALEGGNEARNARHRKGSEPTRAQQKSLPIDPNSGGREKARPMVTSEGVEGGGSFQLPDRSITSLRDPRKSVEMSGDAGDLVHFGLPSPSKASSPEPEKPIRLWFSPSSPLGAAVATAKRRGTSVKISRLQKAKGGNDVDSPPQPSPRPIKDRYRPSCPFSHRQQSRQRPLRQQPHSDEAHNSSPLSLPVAGWVSFWMGTFVLLFLFFRRPINDRLITSCLFLRCFLPSSESVISVRLSSSGSSRFIVELEARVPLSNDFPLSDLSLSSLFFPFPKICSLLSSSTQGLMIMPDFAGE